LDCWFSRPGRATAAYYPRARSGGSSLCPLSRSAATWAGGLFCLGAPTPGRSTCAGLRQAAPSVSPCRTPDPLQKGRARGKRQRWRPAPSGPVSNGNGGVPPCVSAPERSKRRRRQRIALSVLLLTRLELLVACLTHSTCRRRDTYAMCLCTNAKQDTRIRWNPLVNRNILSLQFFL
jgi:hypothetical protein